VASTSLAARTIFASRSFRQYYVGQTLSLVGDGLRMLAVPLLVYRLTGSALSTGVSYICEIAPFSVFGLIGGSFADRLDRRALMIGTDAVRCAIMAAFALLFARHELTIPMIYGGLVLLSVCAAFFMGGQASSIPFLLGRERGTEAVAALASAENTSNLVTPIVGGALFSIFGPMPALIVNAGTYLLSQLSLARIPTVTYTEGPDSTLLTGFGFYIDGKLYDEMATPLMPKSGTAEEWTIVNKTTESHPFHIHVNSFQLTHINGVSVGTPQVWDTFLVPPQANGTDGSITLRIRFKEFKGKTVHHCHVLPHEDTGMMQNLLIT
jgi:MFS family permease